MGIGGMGFGGCMKPFSYMQSIVSDTDPFGDGSLIAKYLLDGDATDLCGNYDGTETDISYKSGKFGDACESTSENGVITTLDNLYTHINVDNCTFSTWFNASEDDTYGVLLSDYYSTSSTNDDNTFMHLCKLDDNTVQVMTRGDGDDSNSAKYTGYFDNNWHNITVTVGSGGIYNVYIDSIYKESFTRASGTYDADIPLAIGNRKYDDVYNKGFTGLIDQVEIYNRALNPQEIQMLYTQSKYIKDPTLAIPGLVAHYPLNGTAEDLTGNHNGTENGGLSYAETEMGIAGNFDGDDDYIELPDIPVLFNNTSFTVSSWCKINQSNTVEQSIFNLEGMNEQCFVLSMGYNDNYSYRALVRSKNDFDNQLNIKYGSDLLTDAYHNVLMVFNHVESKLFLYVDGVLLSTDDSNDLTGVLDDDFSRIDIGVSSGGERYINGYIKNVRIYDRALKEEEINTIYNYEKITRDIVVDRGLVAYYPLKNSGEDHYVNQYDGTDNGDVSYDGNSASFDGDGDYIKLDNSLKSFTNSDYSYSFWIKKNGTDDDNYVPLNIRNNNGGSQDGTKVGCIVIVHDNRIELNSIGSDDDNWLIAETDYVLNNTFIHLTVSTIGNDHLVHINGELNTDLKVTTSGNITITDDDQLLVGVHHYSNDEYVDYFNGNIANIRFYNRVLTPEEITTIYNTEKSQFE